MITINYYKSLSENSSSNPSITDKELVHDIHRLSCLMKKPNMPVWHTFLVIFLTLAVQEKSLFFSANKNNKKVAFGFCSFGKKNTDSKKLEFFAVEEQYRRQGIGTSVIKKFIKDEVGNTSLTLACHRKLRKFYKQFGLKHMQNSEDSGEIIMAINGFDSNYKYYKIKLTNGRYLKTLEKIEKIEKLYNLSFDKKDFSNPASGFFVPPITR
jgi:GNAT superfamily N-acetyltransferase